MIWWISGILLLLITVAVSAYTYRICFHSPKKRSEDPFAPMAGSQYEAVQHLMFKSTRIMADTEYEPVSITSHDGLKLSGRYYSVTPGAPLILAFHGYRSMALRDCSGAFAMALKLGFNILAVDQRGHGSSEGHVISFGIKERQDCLTWVQYANGRFGSIPIILNGLSMGAATVLMAADLPLPENVCCIMADCPYSSPAAIIRKVAKDNRYPEKLVYPFIYLGARLFGGFDLTGSSAVSAVKNAKIPILLIHGEGDRFVPCQMSHEIYRNCKGFAQLHTFPDAGHGLSYVLDYQRYEKICMDFLKSIPKLTQYFDE